jgi:hypothetical protein
MMTRALGIVLFLFVLLACDLRAQRADVRLSAPEPPTHRLPADALIQSAATTGTATIAAWGTTVPAPDGGLANRIVTRVVAGSGISEEGVITDSASRPYRFVQAIAMRRAFLILWNDRRSDAPGLYARRVGLDGAPLGDAVRLDSGEAVPDSTGALIALDYGARGRLLLAQLARQGGGLFALRFDDAANLVGSPRRLGDVLRGALTFARLPGLILLNVAGGDPLMLRSDGTFDPRPIRHDLLDAPYYLTSDTTLLRLTGDTAQFFVSIFDSLPSRIVKVPALDTAIANSALVALDVAGVPEIFFAVLRIVPGHLYMTGYRIPLMWDGASAAAVPLFTHHQENGYADINANLYFLTSLTGSSFTMGCDNTGLVTLAWETTEYVRLSPQPTTTGTTSISLDAGGGYTYGGAGYDGSCIQREGLLVVRLADTTRSSIGLFAHGDTVVLATPSAPRVIDLPEQLPVLGLHNGQLLGAWKRRGAVESTVLAEWDAGSGGIAHTLDSVITGPYAERPKDRTYQGTMHLSDLYLGGSPLAGINGALGFPFNNMSADIETIWTSEASYHSTLIFGGSSTLYLPDTSGWRSALTFTDGAIDFYYARGICHEIYLLGYDPNRDEYLVAADDFITQMPPGRRDRVIRGMTASGTNWSLDTLAANVSEGAFVPVDQRVVLRIANDVAIRIRNGGKLDTFQLPHPYRAASYMRLLGPRFLRWYLGDSLNTELHLDLFDLDCNLLASQRITMPLATDRVTLVQSRYDSAIAVVRADSTGVYATLLDGDLAIAKSDLPISATHTSDGMPSAAFNHDTLFAVWSDTRNGGHDIYGNVLTNARRASVGDDRDRAARSAIAARVVPSPATSGAMLELADASEGQIAIEILDLRGALVRRQTCVAAVAGGGYQLDLDGIPSGLYLVRYRAGAERGFVRFSIIR